jgi:tetratricopeptide (TPR) repeat protein
LAAFYEQVGDAQRARDTYQRILELEPTDAKAQLALAGKPGLHTEEARYISSLRSVFENPDLAIDLKLSRILPFIAKVAETNDPALAASTLALTELLERVHPGEAKAFAASADLLYHSGRRREAIERYEKTLTLDETVYLVWEQLLHAYHEEKEYVALRRRADEALDLFPNRAEIHYLYGVACLELGQPRQAVDALEQALLMGGGDVRIAYLAQSKLGRAYQMLNRLKDADAAFEAALKLNARSVNTLAWYSYALAQRGERLDQAEAFVKQGLAIAPQHPYCQAAQGWILYKRKDFSGAKNWLGKALENGAADNAQVLEHYGDALFHTDGADAALPYWSRALQKLGVSATLEKKINERRLHEQ